MRSPRLLALALGAALALSACSGGNSAQPQGGEGTATSGGSLVVDTAFSLETADPGNTYDPTGNTIAKALYETLVDFKGSDVSTPVPGLASWTQNADATQFTFTLEGGHTFSDGSPVEASDVVFTMQRVQGMKEAKPNFLLNGITVEQVDDTTVRFTSATPSLQLPAILANPALGIVNADVVKEHGGTTDGSDTAKAYLDTASAGSGPFVLDAFDVTSQVVLKRNPKYEGDEAPGYDRVVVRNTSESATQLINLQGGDSQVALDLNGDQVTQLKDGFTVASVPSASTIFLLVNQDPAVGGITANAQFAAAVRSALDYSSLLELAGAGAVQATGVIPPGFTGALPTGATQDLAASKAALAASGYDGSTIRLQYPNDYPVGGVEFTPLAERVQSQLKAAGINVELAPAPIATELDAYVAGKEGFSMWFWGPDYADSANFLPFGPGLKVGLRAGWTVEAAPQIAQLATTAGSATDPAAREGDFAAFAQALQEQGPFVPLIVPGSNIATANTVTGAAYNSVWTVDLAELKPTA
ncbi:peptide/nickel transport system substrate-binding protein [Quadrisphaera granulorum]|uniref:Peptide/nickel transport system substrate-binding protein n=1 Tax=Quadrisphaera granulorum TaxID=317664 RepID=A0A316A7F8_9ACTN|nr:ABC transporter substrate-binding protein [Quadrisphaera granulorum]PWJ53811.1 peptide/nickel transport system substrate-binding protein [Quadrisphaera granulorum]SZE96568.1 peptide/nickel transport system substrate-binding protein [Quadrisphaera granulorum]